MTCEAICDLLSLLNPSYFLFYYSYPSLLNQ